ncbi:MAG: hypothetical protein JOY93_11105, partial [Acidobacteriales bacterium]|nr:hypothetical protein [Terriglobales bacterium]
MPKTRATFLAGLLLLGASLASSQTINLTAGASSTVLPDGSSVPMWGYNCGKPDSTTNTPTATCAALNPNAGGGWSPVIITVTGSSLQINLTNNLPNPVPTSLVIVGQFGGGLGQTATTAPSPSHASYYTTWPIANSGPAFTPPAQAARVQSFATEVPSGNTTQLTWSNLRPGTYLIESGTHPSIQGAMGLYGMLVVTTPPGNSSPGTAYPNVSYSAEVPLLMSEIDPRQNSAVAAAVATPGFSESATYGPTAAGPVVSVNVINGGANYTSAPTVTFSGGGGSGATATAVTNSAGAVTAINIVTGGSGYISPPTVILSGGGGTGASATAVLQGLTANSLAHCNGGAAACYPPVVNYTPLYYLFNGVAFDKTNAAKSLFAAQSGSASGPVTGNVLVRFVNAGLRMHVPSIVGAQTGGSNVNGFSLIAEDGNPLPGVPRVQNEVFMAAGKTYDVMLNAPTPTAALPLPVFDRQLSLSANAIARDAGMLAYISVNGGKLPSAGSIGAAKAVPDTYNALFAGVTFNVTDPSKGVIANDTNVYGVTLLAQASNGTVTLSKNGTFTYVPNSTATSDQFSYCANGTVTGTTCSSGVTATVTLGPSSVQNTAGVTCTAPTFNASVSGYFATKGPGLLAYCKDGAGLPITIDTTTITPGSGLTVQVDPNGGFTASASSAVSTFTFQAQNSQNGHSATMTATINFPPGGGLVVNVVDGQDKKTAISDYRWIIEEDRTFFVDPKCAQNPPSSGCPNSANGVVPNFGTNFHTSYMPVIATGCTGAASCGSGQTVQGQPVTLPAFTDPSKVALCSSVPANTPCLDPNKRYYISVLPGDAAQPFISGWGGAPDCSTTGQTAGKCGHGMGGAPIPKGLDYKSQSITVLTQPSPYQTATLSVFVFEDDYPLNGEHDAGGGVDVLSPNEPGLGGFQITLDDSAGGTGDATGTPTYDMFNMPLTNSLAGTKDPATGNDACPI